MSPDLRSWIWIKDSGTGFKILDPDLRSFSGFKILNPDLRSMDPDIQYTRKVLAGLRQSHNCFVPGCHSALQFFLLALYVY